jgi:hypothetical protein
MRRTHDPARDMERCGPKLGTYPPRLAFICPLSSSAADRPPKGDELAARAQVGRLPLPGDQGWQRCAALL